MKAVVTGDGKIAIPEELRKRLGIRAGEILDWTEEQGRLIGSRTVAPKGSHRTSLDKAYGILNAPQSTNDWIEELRGKPDAI